MVDFDRVDRLIGWLDWTGVDDNGEPNFPQCFKIFSVVHVVLQGVQYRCSSTCTTNSRLLGEFGEGLWKEKRLEALEKTLKRFVITFLIPVNIFQSLKMLKKKLNCFHQYFNSIKRKVHRIRKPHGL